MRGQGRRGFAAVEMIWSREYLGIIRVYKSQSDNLRLCGRRSQRIRSGNPSNLLGSLNLIAIGKKQAAHALQMRCAQERNDFAMG